MKIKILLTLIMLWSVLVVTAQTPPTTAPVPGEGATDCAAITTGVGTAGATGTGTGTGAGTHGTGH